MKVEARLGQTETRAALDLQRAMVAHGGERETRRISNASIGTSDTIVDSILCTTKRRSAILIPVDRYKVKMERTMG